jgi:hypothetical protein
MNVGRPPNARCAATTLAAAMVVAACSVVPGTELSADQAVDIVVGQFDFQDVTVISVDGGIAGDLDRGVLGSYGSIAEWQLAKARMERPAWRVVLRGLAPSDCESYPACPLHPSSVEAIIDRFTGQRLTYTKPAPPPN